MKPIALALAIVAMGTAPKAPRQGPVVARVSATPDTARIGKAVKVVYEVTTPLGGRVQFPVRPANDSTWTWNDWKVEKEQDTPQGVRHRVTAVALPFKTGRLALPALGFRSQRVGEAPRAANFPTLTLPVVTVLPSGKPPDIRGLKPVFQPPWWMTFPWWIVALVLLAAGLVFFWLKRRKRPLHVTPEAKKTLVPAIPAHAEALAALEALVAEKLPERGLWVEFQTRLAAILRRFLERRFGSPQPGYTTRELMFHLVWSGLTGGDVERLKALLRVSDLAKFARSEPTVEIARRQEIEARSLILAWADKGPEPAADTAPPLPKAG
ncbi:MAG TPA: hypothetical protein VKF80_01475 [Candidatus Eisenbacteria bacterium]|nr:hypothetical protein [Candidatus Eisenbacteria bacterium]